MARILVIDDDAEIHEALRGPLRQIGHVVTYLDSAEDGLDLLKDERFDAVLLDNRMPRMNGLEFLEKLKERGVTIPVILMTGSLNLETVIEARRLGAIWSVVKPADCDKILPELEPEIRRALESGRRLEEVPIPNPDASDDSLIVGRSRPMIEVFRQIAVASEGDEPVLILGETGTGKDLVAQAIHTNSARKDNPFVVINCAGITEELMNDELFGHVQTAFTGADKARKGYFEQANGGTLFLDEVGDMPPKVQAALLRVLQSREIMRVGGNERIKVDVRVLSATHRDLKACEIEGAFREDLYYRLAGESIVLPPLRDREGDVELLARRFLSQKAGNQTPPGLHPDALQALRSYRWPGNIREMQNVIRVAMRKCRDSRRTEILSQDLELDKVESPAGTGPGDNGLEAALTGLRAAIAWAWNSGRSELWTLLAENLERELLRHAIAQPLLSQDRLATRLGVSKDMLRDLIKKYIPAEIEEEAKADTKPDDDPCTKGIAILVTVHQKGEKIKAKELARRMGVTRAQLYENAELARVREMGNRLFNLFSEKAKIGDYRGPQGNKTRKGQVEAQDTAEDDD